VCTASLSVEPRKTFKISVKEVPLSKTRDRITRRFSGSKEVLYHFYSTGYFVKIGSTNNQFTIE
jgi:hypothetical protein